MTLYYNLTDEQAVVEYINSHPEYKHRLIQSYKDLIGKVYKELVEVDGIQYRFINTAIHDAFLVKNVKIKDPFEGEFVAKKIIRLLGYPPYIL